MTVNIIVDQCGFLTESEIFNYAFAFSGIAELSFEASSQLETIYKAVSYFPFHILLFSYSTHHLSKFKYINCFYSQANVFTNIKSVWIPESVTEILDAASSNSQLLEEVIFESSSQLETTIGTEVSYCMPPSS